MTDLLYLPDADDVTDFSATVTETTPEYIVLEGTYFYPEGGGQPPDHGTIAWSFRTSRISARPSSHAMVPWSGGWPPPSG